MKNQQPKTPDVAEDYAQEFCQTGGGLFAKTEELCAKIEKNEFQVSKEQIKEFFRLAHTLKGNAAMFGFEKQAQFAHVIEDFLEKYRDSQAIDPNEARFLCWAMLELIQNIKQGSAENESAPFLSGEKNKPFFLLVEFDSRHFLIPGSAVSQVVFKPEILRIPLSPKGYGVIHSNAGWTPLADLSVLLHKPKKELGKENEISHPMPMGEVRWAVVLSNGCAFRVDEVVEMVEFPFLSGYWATRASFKAISVLPIGAFKSG